jgi:hypothetical protein
VISGNGCRKLPVADDQKRIELSVKRAMELS